MDPLIARGVLLGIRTEQQVDNPPGPRPTVPATLSGDTFQTSRKIPEQVFATGEPQLVADLYDEMSTEAHAGTIQIVIRTVYCVPLKLIWHVEHPDDTAAARPVGVLYLDSRERASLNTLAIQKSLQRLAADAASAIEDALDERPR